MAFTGAFTRTKLSATALNAFRLTDTSSFTSEAKITFSARIFYLVKNDGTYVLSPTGLDYWDFSFASYPSDQITVNVLEEDIALTVYMVWTSSSPQSGSTYYKKTVFDFVDYANYFKYVKIQQMAYNRTLVSNKNFFGTLSILQTLIDSSEACIDHDDQYGSQQCIVLSQQILSNPNMFY